MPPRNDDDQDLLDFVPERLDDGLEPAGKGGGGRLLFSAALGLAVVVASGVTVWYLFSAGQGPASPDSIPVIAADTAPVKQRPGPEDRGGMAVPNQDKLVYERLGPGEGTRQVERLLPPPEAPQPPPIKAADALAKAPPPLAAPRPERVETLTSEPTQPAPAPQAAVVTEEPVAPPPAPTVTESAAAPAAEPARVAAAAPPPPPAPPAAAKPAAGEFQVQLAAMRAPEAAKAEWERIKKANADLLGGLSSDIVKADLGKKGVFYRLRAGSLAEADARRLCDELGKRKIGCMVVRK